MFDEDTNPFKRKRYTIEDDYIANNNNFQNNVFFSHYNKSKQLAENFLAQITKTRDFLKLASSRTLSESEISTLINLFNSVFNSSGTSSCSSISLTSFNDILNAESLINIINKNTRIALKIFEVVFNQNVQTEEFLKYTFLDTKGRCEVLKSIEVLTRLVQHVDVPVAFIDEFLRAALHKSRPSPKKTDDTEKRTSSPNQYQIYRSNFIEGIKRVKPNSDNMDIDESPTTKKPAKRKIGSPNRENIFKATETIPQNFTYLDEKILNHQVRHICIFIENLIEKNLLPLPTSMNLFNHINKFLDDFKHIQESNSLKFKLATREVDYNSYLCL